MIAIAGGELEDFERAQVLQTETYSLTSFSMDGLWEKKAHGFSLPDDFSLWDRTAPTPESEASTSTMN